MLRQIVEPPQVPSGLSELNELQQIRFALDQSSIVAITDRSGMILYVNERFLSISKYSREELIGKTHRVINSGYHSKEFFKTMWETILSGQVWRGEIRNRAKDGELYWVDTTVTPILDEKGLPVRFIAIRNDITERKQLEAQKDEFIAVASHELKTPLTSIKAYAHILNQSLEKTGDPKNSSLVEKLTTQIDKLSRLVSNMLDVSRIQSGTMVFNGEWYEVNELIQNVIEDVSAIHQNTSIVSKLNPLPRLHGDPDRIEQVIRNLITNAIKYSPGLKPITIQSYAVEDRVLVSVTDRGTGIPEKDQKQIFTRFYRSKNHLFNEFPGWGLGLYIAREIIHQHQGHIWFESKEGEGSTFYISLPILKQSDREI